MTVISKEDIQLSFRCNKSVPSAGISSLQANVFRRREQLKGCSSLERIPTDVAAINTADLRCKCSSKLRENNRYQIML